MADRPTTSQPEDASVKVLDGGFWLVVAMAVVCGVLVLAAVARGALTPGGPSPATAGAAANPSASSSATPIEIASFLYSTPRDAPAIELTDPDARPFSLTSFRGEPSLVFFGYTHCPDVCPATIGTMGLAMDAFGPGVHAAFVTVDPERDTPDLAQGVRPLPAGRLRRPDRDCQIRTTADAWGVRYARVESATPGAYSMSHTADVYLVDANGILRAHFPFGTEAPAMTAVLREVVSTTTAVAAPSAPPQAAVAASATPAPASAAPVAAPALPTTSPSSRRRSGPVPRAPSS